MAEKNIFGLPPREDEVSASIKSLEKQRENLDKRLRAEGVDPDTLGGDFDNRNLLEKALNLTPDQGVLLDFFEILNRPVQAVKGFIAGGYSGTDPITGAWEGLSGQRVITGREIMTGDKDADYGGAIPNLIADIAVDIALDPLTYVPAGFFLKGLKGITRQTSNKVFQIAKIKQQKVINGIRLKYGVGAKDDILPFLEKAAKDGKSSEVFKFTKNDVGEFILANVDEAKLADYIEAPVGKTIQEAVEAGNYVLKEKGKALAKSQYGPLSKVIDYLEQRISTIAKGDIINTRYRNSQLLELDAVKTLQSYIQQFGDDYKVVATRTADNLDDVVILKRFENTDYWTNVGSIELKYFDDAVRKSAYGKRVNLLFKGRRPADAIRFAEGSPLSGTTFETDFFSRLNEIRVRGTLGESLGQRLKTFINQKKNFVFKNEVLPEDMPKLKQLMYNWYKDSGMDIIYAGGTNGEARFVRLADIFDELDISKTELVISKNNAGEITEAYIKGGFNIDLAKVSDRGAYLLSEDIAKQFVQKEMQISVSFLDNLATKGGFVGATAKGLQQAFQRLGTALNATFNFSESAKRAYKFITGETNLFIQRSSARLNSIRNDAIARYQGSFTKDVGILIKELMESGAYFDDAQRLQVIDTSVHLDDFMDYLQGMLSKSSRMSETIPLFSFGSSGTQAATNIKRRFLDRLNGIARNTDADFIKMFDVVEQGDATILKFNGTLDDFKRIKQQAAREAALGTRSPFLKFGRRSVSFEAQELLKKDPELIRRLQSLQDDILGTLAREGGFRDIMTELIGKQGYVRHIMTKEAFEEASTKGVGAISRMAKPGSDLLKKRAFAMGTIDDLNAVFKEFHNMEVNVFNTNAFDAVEDLIKVTARNVEQAKMLKLVLTQTDKQGQSLFRIVNNTKIIREGLDPKDVMIKSFEDEFPALFKNLSSESQEMINKILIKRKANIGDKAVVINRNALDLLKRAEKAYKDVPQLIKYYDNFLNTWKGLTLITPGFHMRNLFGNMFNSYAVGMDVAAQSEYGLIAMQELNEYARIVKKIADGGNLTAAEESIYKTVSLFESQGLVQSHRGVRDLEYLKEATELATKGGPLKNTYNNAVRFNFNVAEKMDDVQRYMLYRWALDKTGDASQAARMVTESLFDYTHLTGFEKEVMKRVFPFYTFMKNNFIFQAKNIIRNPKLYARTGRAYKYYLEDLAGYSPENLPDYTTENMWLPIPIQINKNDKKAIAFLKANLPLSDFMEIVENPFKKGVVSIAAPIKLPIELGLGRDLFTGRRISAFPGQRNVLAKDGGVFNFLRDERGNLAITQMPLVQKIAAEIGLRTPLSFGSTALDILDTLAGYQGAEEGLADFAARLGLAGVQDMDRLKLTELYQDLEKLREIKKYYEQETGYQLPLLPRG